MVRTLRGRVTLAAVGACALVVVILAGLVVLAVERDDRGATDRLLQGRADVLAGALERTGRDILPPAAAVTLAGGSLASVRLLRGGQVLHEAGQGPAPPLPPADGFSTLRRDGETWRSYTRPVGDGGLRLQVAAAQPGGVSSRPLRRRLTGLAALSLAAAAGLAWVLSGLALRPLPALAVAASHVARTRDLGVRVPQGHGVAEVEALAASLNVMLARLEESAAQLAAALEASRRFAADAGHELRSPLTALQANVDVLRRNPGLAEQERNQVLAELAHEHARMLALLDALQALARGDAADTLRGEPLDLAELVDEQAAALRARHPGVQLVLDLPDGPVPVIGHPPGLRLLVANLLENAVRHGAGGQGVVGIALHGVDGAVMLTVDDDGPGIPPGERERVFARFARGTTARGAGLGLGLALVAQQATLHDGVVEIADSPRGGARLMVRLPGPEHGGIPRTRAPAR